MSAILPKGMRAISVAVSAETGAGGFILPNDRVDVLLTRKVDDGSNKKAASTETVLSNVRVLAIDQTFRPKGEEDKEYVVADKTATLELDPRQTEVISMAQDHRANSRLPCARSARMTAFRWPMIVPKLSEKYVKEGKEYERDDHHQIWRAAHASRQLSNAWGRLG